MTSRTMCGFWIGALLLGVTPALAEDWLAKPPNTGRSTVIGTNQVRDVVAQTLTTSGKVVHIELDRSRGQVYVVTDAKVVSRLDASSGRELRTAPVPRPVADIGVSQAGLVVAMPELSEVWVLDRDTLQPLRGLKVPQHLKHVATSAKSNIGFAFHGSQYGRASTAIAFDLSSGAILGTVDARTLGQQSPQKRHPQGLGLYDFSMAEMTPDGKHLFVVSGETLHRLKIGFGTQAPASILTGLSATASTELSSNYPAANTVDGNASSFWVGAYGQAPWTLTVALGSSYALKDINIAWYMSSTYWPRKFDVLASSDGQTYRTVASGASATNASSTIAASGEATHVRIVIHEPATYGVINEVQVRGSKPATGLVYEEAGARIGQNPQRVEISPDSRYIALPSGGGNYGNLTGHPTVTSYSTYVYGTGNLQSPVLAFRGGHYPRCLSFDPALGRLLTGNYDNQLVVLDSQGQRTSLRADSGTNGDYVLTGRGDETQRILVAGSNTLFLQTRSRLLRVTAAQ